MAESLRTVDELRRFVPDVADAKALEILALKPTAADLTEAAMWAEGQGDIAARSGHPLSGKAALIFDILAAEEEEEDDLI